LGKTNVTTNHCKQLIEKVMINWDVLVLRYVRKRKCSIAASPTVARVAARGVLTFPSSYKKIVNSSPVE